MVVFGETGSTAIGGFLPDDSTLVSLVIVVFPSGPVIFVFSWTPHCSVQPATPRTRAAHRELRQGSTTSEQFSHLEVTDRK